MDPEQLARAIAAIDEANGADPTTVTVRGAAGPKELLHAGLVTAWVGRLRPEPSEALLLAARGHHLRRWTVPRSSYPAGRAGYLRWRRHLQRQHADELGELLRREGYAEDLIARVGALVRKEGLGHDPEVQALEDALCLVFLETQLDDVAARLDAEKVRTILARTIAKMSAAGRDAVVDVPMPGGARRLALAALDVPGTAR